MDTTQSIALEISAMIRASSQGREVQNDNVLDAVLRILESDAHSPADALALATFARRILASVVIDAENSQYQQIALLLLGKAEGALEAATGKSRLAFEGEYSEGASHH
ncbi:hypothetical protein FNL55_15765 [Tardiphaga sp. vice352]|uniref:hypothetical protein n=1 Tax=Tardiphaga sp. vice352 TaxID=2592816 RepID=UPI001163A85E|nr:hypothetical protein [Tardiphaga sp. vice352]QDM32644.1 hypothetical protein FNL55_15765 [Tardiphaga sp. vice352]